MYFKKKAFLFLEGTVENYVQPFVKECFDYSKARFVTKAR